MQIRAKSYHLAVSRGRLKAFRATSMATKSRAVTRIRPKTITLLPFLRSKYSDFAGAARANRKTGQKLSPLSQEEARAKPAKTYHLCPNPPEVR